MMWKRVLVAAACAGLTSLSLGAATIGSFNLGGDIFVNGTASITWTDAFGHPNMAIISEASGAYASLNGQEATIQNLNSASEPTGTPFTDTLFVTLPGGFQPLYINMIYAGVDGSADCGATPSAGPPPQLCTPPLPGGALSPFNFENNPPPSSITSTASFAFSGNVGHPASGETWFANFTSQFTVPYQTVLSQLATTGQVSDAYSATFTVNAAPTSTPETSTLSLFALGLGFIVVARSRGLIARRR